MRRRSLYDDDDIEQQDGYTRPADNRCTPEKLLALGERLGRAPTLDECKHEFGGILGAMADHWQLVREGRWPWSDKGE